MKNQFTSENLNPCVFDARTRRINPMRALVSVYLPRVLTSAELKAAKRLHTAGYPKGVCEHPLRIGELGAMVDHLTPALRNDYYAFCRPKVMSYTRQRTET
jgi:hypothetical protein